MKFIVTAMTQMGGIARTCDNPRAAFEEATALATAGADDVLIADGDGVEYALRDFERFFLHDTEVPE